MRSPGLALHALAFFAILAAHGASNDRVFASIYPSPTDCLPLTAGNSEFFLLF